MGEGFLWMLTLESGSGFICSTTIRTEFHHCSCLFSPGMVLVRTETGQLVLVPQQVLAQAQVKAQQGQTAVAQRQMTPTATSPLRVNAATTVSLNVELPSLPSALTRLVYILSSKLMSTPLSTTRVQTTTSNEKSM